MEKEKDSKLKQAMKGLDSFLTTHYSFRYNQITEQCEFHDKHKFDKYRVVDEREFNTLVINAIEEGVNCMDRDMRRYLGSSRIPSFHPVTAYLEHLPHWDGHDRVSELAHSVSDETQWMKPAKYLRATIISRINIVVLVFYQPVHARWLLRQKRWRTQRVHYSTMHKIRYSAILTETYKKGGNLLLKL